MPPVLGRLLNLFRGRPVAVPDTHKIPDGEARKVDVGDPLAGGTQIVLCRVEGRLFALDTRCPHEGGRIQPGPLAEERYAVCPLHNYRFDPESGKAANVSCAPARTYRVEERGGSARVWI